FDIILDMILAPSRSPKFSISYRCPRISKPYAISIASTFQRILAEMALHSGDEVGHLDCVSDNDKQRMVAWNPKNLYAQMTCVHYLVEAVARVIPNSEAVCSWDGSLSYTQLDTLSSNAARRLVRAGVGVGQYVPFAFEKSLWTVVATLAILKAGGAFVPLDPSHPSARLQEILERIKADVVVTSELFFSKFKGIARNVIVVSAQTAILNQQQEAEDSHRPIVQSSDPVFVLFTSGSTGQPKGMIHEHGAICTHAIAHGMAMNYQGKRVLQFASHTFDVAIIDIFTTLIFGGSICIPSEEDRLNNITNVINSMNVNYAILTPSFANLIDPNHVPTLKTLAIGGEALTQDRIQRWADKVSLIQIYGPAEVGICLIMQMHSKQAGYNDTLPETVGYPLCNSSCWLVDPENPNLLVPIGAVGELVVAGPSLANSYLNNDAKTQSSFLTNLTWAKALGLKFQRFYRTGDLLRYNIDALDGSYDFIGRRDTQIKLHGQRIETGEVEHHIAGIPGVATSMVTQPKDGCYAGDLIAVVQMRSSQSLCVQKENQLITMAPDQSLSVETIREYLSKSLPAYMWPAACLVITSMPFIPSMKINRRSVDTWLTNMRSRPIQVATLVNLKHSPLDPSEITANALSVKFAELVASKDNNWRLKLERSDFNLQKAGIDSIQIVSLSMFLQRVYAAKIPMYRLLSSKTTIRDLAYWVDHHNPSSAANGHTTIDVLDESRVLRDELFRDIEDRIPKTDSESPPQIRNIFLTGASGYLGSAILQDLLAKPGIFIFALVRCLTESEGLRRIIDAAIKTGWWQEAYASRIQVWKGELTEGNFGLDDQQLRRLHGTGQEDDYTNCIHAVIHNGAKVHYNFDYETLKAVNVQPTLDLLKITANAAHLSTFIYVSGGQKPRTDGEAKSVHSYAGQINEGNGYAQSKFISEHIVGQCVGHTSFAHKRLHTVKPGYIIGSRTAGIANQTDFIWRLIAGCLEVKAYNRDEAAKWLFIADVDNVAKRIVAGIFDPLEYPGNIEPVLDGLLFSDLWALLTERFGYALEALPHEEWLGRLQVAIAAKQEAHLLFPLLHILDKEGGTVGVTEIPNVETARTRDAVERNVRYLIEVGFLPAPPTRTPEEKLNCVIKVAAGVDVDV
ncbi:hypothetical protein MMC12_008083, partial [Toensbergia leucococca]|nr:hypothetical protein [Toensbergia leucococca]